MKTFAKIVVGRMIPVVVGLLISAYWMILWMNFG